MALSPFELFEQTASAWNQCGIEFDVTQFTAALRKMDNLGALKYAKTTPVDPETKAAADEKKAVADGKRQKIGDWLLANVPPSYNGERGTALSLTEILTKAGVAVDRSTMSIGRSLLESPTQRFHEWGAVARVNEQTLYARSARLIEFRRVA